MRIEAMLKPFLRSNAEAGLALTIALAVAPVSRAALGGDVASVVHDHEALRADDVVSSTDRYDVHEAQSPEGVRVRQYVDRASGKVFALAWEGPRSPDVNALLGAYASRYQAAAKANHGSHHVLSVSDPDFAVTVLRLQRGWQGLAYLPGSLPQGVSRDELR
jgi:hypothetical protein